MNGTLPIETGRKHNILVVFEFIVNYAIYLLLNMKHVILNRYIMFWEGYLRKISVERRRKISRVSSSTVNHTIS